MINKCKEFSLEKVSLSPLQCEIIIKLLKEGIQLHQEEIEKRVNGQISGISKALQRLKNKGLVYEIKDSVKFYGLNPYRIEEIKRFITGYELGKNKTLVLSGHASVYESEINDLPDKLARRLEKDSSFISYSPKGWKYAFKKSLPDGSFKFHKTNNNCKLIAYFRTFGFNASTIEQINNEKFFSLKSELEDEYQGLKIGKVERVASCPWHEYAILKDPIAVAGIELGVKHKEIEQSYGYPEWEEKGINAVEKINNIVRLRQLCAERNLSEEQIIFAVDTFHIHTGSPIIPNYKFYTSGTNISISGGSPTL